MGFYLGTSGFAYPEWRGVFYPSDLRERQMLSFFATRFNSVEINYTFRRYPSETTLAGWRDQTPQGFMLTLKANQQITHWRRLADCDEPVSRFLDEAARPLGDRLGVILFQTPPNLPYDRTLIESFLAYLPPTFRYAFEFRHPSWTQARDVLASQHAAWCVAETDGQLFTEDQLPPGPFVYLRLRKLEYEEAELQAWARRIEPALAEGQDVFCYFKHEEKGAGPRFAERMQVLLGSAATSSSTNNRAID
jgi:uncharacterized protein YecE (DUF72 family)